MNDKLLRYLRQFLREVFAPALLLLAALLFLWEEVLWTRLGRAMERAGRFGPMPRIEASLAALDPYRAFAAFLIPGLLTYPPRLIALWLIAIGHFWAGVAMLAALEILSAAILARIYVLCAPALRTLKWFAWGEATLLRWKDWAHRHLGIKMLREVMDEAVRDVGGEDTDN